MNSHTEERLGNFPTRYSFALNPYESEKISLCPTCRGNTFKRKFPLVIMVENAPVLTLGLTCKYCSKCEFIIAHQHELEYELSSAYEKIAPSQIGNDYHVIGVMDKKMWRKKLKTVSPFGDTNNAITIFKEYLILEFSPGGWSLAGGQ